MDSPFDLMEYMKISMASDWLCHLTNSPIDISEEMLMELCENFSIPVYIDCSALQGYTGIRSEDSIVVHTVIGTSHCQVESPCQAYKAIEPNINEGFSVLGLAAITSELNITKDSHVFSWILTSPEGRSFLFKPSDIRTLASYFKPSHEVKPKTLVAKKIPATEQRIMAIQQWFETQHEYKSEDLSLKAKGLPGARDACWTWITTQGLADRDALFAGSRQQGSNKSKVFISAWNTFKNIYLIN